jgi:hypothetical protein
VPFCMGIQGLIQTYISRNYILEPSGTSHISRTRCLGIRCGVQGSHSLRSGGSSCHFLGFCSLIQS